MKYRITLNGNVYEVEVEKGQASAVLAGKQEELVTAPVVNKEVEVKTSAETTAVNVEGQAITAPMPGKIVDVRVSNGQKVKAGEILFLLEAMKMENEIVAPSDGTITSVSVSKGNNVDRGQTLAGLK